MKFRKPISFTLSAALFLGGLTACGTDAQAPSASTPDSAPSVSAPASEPLPSPSEDSALPVQITPSATPAPLPEPSATPGVISPVPTQSQPGSDDPENDRTAMLAAYAAALEGFYYDHVYPNGDELPLIDYIVSGPADLALNRFAIYDVDGDGEDELLFLFTTAITAQMQLTVYRYDPDFPGSLMVELMDFPSVAFYDNGVVQAEMSHNHSRGEALWPYFLYSYDPISDTYEYVASVESWDKALFPDDFPDETDADGDGIIYLYYLGTDAQTLDGPAYQEWFDAWLGGAQPLEIPYQDFTEENIRAIQ